MAAGACCCGTGHGKRLAALMETKAVETADGLRAVVVFLLFVPVVVLVVIVVFLIMQWSRNNRTKDNASTSSTG